MSTTLERGQGSPGPDLPESTEWNRNRAGMFTRLRKRVLRPLVIIPLVVVVAGGVWFLTRSSSSTTANAGTVDRIVAVTSGTLKQTVSVSGTLAPANMQTLNFGTSGKVTAVNVQAGQHVTASTVLATIDSAALQGQVTQAQATVDSATAKLSSDETSGASSAQVTADQATLAAAQAQLASAQASLSGATLTAPIDGTISVVNLTVGEQLSGTGTSGTNITGTGTGSGRTSAASSGSGSGGGGGGGGSSSSSSSGTSSSTQIQLVSAGSFIVNLNVDDTQIGRIAPGQQVTITPSSTPGNGSGGGGGRFRQFAGGGQGLLGGQGGQNGNNTPTTTVPGQDLGSLNQTQTTTATGTVTSVGAIATTSSGVASFPVVVSVTGSPQGFFAGATVQAAITYNQLDNVLQVPTLAITRTNGQDYVTVSQNGKHSRRAVTTGLTSGGQTQITNGLTRGELVVVSIPTRVAGGATSNNATTGNRGFGGGGGGLGGGGFTRGGD